MVASMFRTNEIVIDDKNYLQFISDMVVDGEQKKRGLIPRDYAMHPVGSYRGIRKFDMKLIPRNEWSSRIKDMVQAESRLSDIRLSGMNGEAIPSLDQNGRGYCWTHSVTSCMMILRALSGVPYVRLSAYAVACMIKNFRDEGGWNPLALEFIMERGIPSVEFWPEKSVNRNNDNAATWANAAKHKVTEGFVDIEPAVYDRNLTYDQVMTCLLSGIPVAADFNWWGHSICLLDAVEFDSSLSLMDINRWGIREWNSWSDGWSERGMSVLRGSKSVPNGATAPRVTMASAA